MEILPDVWFDALQHFMDDGGILITTGNTALLTMLRADDEA